MSPDLTEIHAADHPRSYFGLVTSEVTEAGCGHLPTDADRSRIADVNPKGSEKFVGCSVLRCIQMSFSPLLRLLGH